MQTYDKQSPLDRLNRKLEAFHRDFQSDGPGTAVSNTWIALGKWWRQGEPFQLTKSGYVRFGECRIGLDDPITRSFRDLLVTGRFEKPERKAIKRYLDSRLPVIEFGGCIGVVACTTNRLLRSPDRHVVVEANPEITPVLTANRDRNGARFSVLQRAIGYDTDHVDFQIDEANFLASSIELSQGKSIRVPVITLAAVLEQYGFERCSLICDIEGTEVELVDKEFDVLKERVALIVMEVHEKLRGKRAIDGMLGRLVEIGFQIEYRAWDTYVLKNRGLA